MLQKVAQGRASSRPWIVSPDWIGEPVFIICGGVSVETQDLALLHGRRVIVINSSFARYPEADILFFGDARWWRWNSEKIGLFGGRIATSSGILHPRVDNLKNSRRRGTPEPPIALSVDPAAVPVRRTSVTGAVNLARHLNGGAAPIVTIGLDGQAAPDGRTHHHPPHPEKQKPGCWNEQRLDLAQFATSLRAVGVTLYNASPGSALADLWQTMSLEHAIALVDGQRSDVPVTAAQPAKRKPALVVTGMLGLGDNLHQRAVLRTLMTTHDVWLQSYYAAVFHDLVGEGLKLLPMPRPLARIRESLPMTAAEPAPGASRRKISYDRSATLKHNSVVAAQFASVGLKAPAEADFSLPVPEAWRARARDLIAGWDTGGRPLMVYRPVVQNNFWRCPARSPDPVAYDALYRAIRDRFFVVSVANLRAGEEWVLGPRADVDVELHAGEADFETLAGLFAEARLVFGNAGFTPILAQAVGTPNIVVYGGNEGWPETNRAGAHLAPTLPIEADRPCRCHMRFHDCDKTITLAPAVEKVVAFAEANGAAAAPPPPRILIFGTVYADTPDKAQLARRWAEVHKHVNPGCDFLLVDSASPEFWAGDGGPKPGAVLPDVPVWSFPDNIGHMARGGQDGWGRAFCHGLSRAIDEGYDYVAHIEGDSLFRLPVGPIVRQMQRDGHDVVTVPVVGTKRPESEWVETGLMFFRTAWLADTRFIERYHWRGNKPYPLTPEAAVARLVGDKAQIMVWRVERGDRGQITADNATTFDWITHCPAAATDRFAEEVLAPRRALAGVKLNFGCGENRLAGWTNFDADIDIAKPLPFPDDHADFIFAEHVVEHVDFYTALEFFRECARVLKPWGMIRIAVPSIERIAQHGDRDYFRFAGRWAPSEDLRGAMHAILFAHGHKAAWTDSLLKAALVYAGFKTGASREPGQSPHRDLCGVEGHHRIIGARANWIETAVVEAEVDK